MIKNRAFKLSCIFIGLLWGISAVLLVLTSSQAMTLAFEWEAPTNVSNTAGSSYSPRLAVTSQGVLHMVWTDWVDTGMHLPYIVYANRPAGGSWSSLAKLPGEPQGSTPVAVIDSSGNLHVVWYGGGGHSIVYRRRSSAGSWSTQETVATDSTYDLYSPDVAVAPNGTIHVVWRRRLAYNNSDIYYNNKPSGGGWSTPTLVYDGGDTTGDAVIAADNLGALFLFIYNSSGGSYFTKRATDGTWSTPQASEELILSVDQLNTDFQGRLHLVWPGDFDYMNNTYSLFYASKEPGEEYFSMPVTVTEGCGSTMAVTGDSAGRAHVTWETGGKLWYAFQLPDGGWSVPSQAASATPGNAGLSLSVDSSGRRHVAWSLGPDQDVWYTGINGEPSASGVIASSGGVLLSTAKRTKLTFPSGSVTTDTLVTHAAATGQSTGELFGLDFFDLAAKRVSDNSPVTSFPVSYTLVYTYTSPSAAIESTLGLYSWNGSGWTEEPASLNTSLNRLTATLNHMSLFAILGETNPIYLPLILR